MSLKLIKQNFYKLFTSVGFYACVAITFVLSFTASVSVKPDGFPENLFEVIFTKSGEELMRSTEYCFTNVVITGGGWWLAMFIPIIAAFPFIPIFSDERDSRFGRSVIFRSGKFRYNTGNFFSAFFASGFAIAIGYSLFLLVTSFIFPNLSEYPEDMREMIEIMLTGNVLYVKFGTIGLVFSEILEIFLYSAMWSLPAFLLCSLIRNKYLIICIPFFLKYSIDGIFSKIQNTVSADFENIDIKKLEIISTLNPNGLMYIFQDSNALQVLLVTSGFLLAGFVLFNVLMNRRLDLGD
jgi:hypothetical protein